MKQKVVKHTKINTHHISKKMNLKHSNDYYIEKRDSKISALKNSSFGEMFSKLDEKSQLEVLLLEPYFILTLKNPSLNLWENVCLYNNSLLREVPIDLVNDKMILNALQNNVDKHGHIFDTHVLCSILSKKKFSQDVQWALIDTFGSELNDYAMGQFSKNLSDESLMAIIDKKKEVLKGMFCPSQAVIEYAVQKDYRNLKYVFEFNHLEEIVFLKIALKALEKRAEAGRYIPFLQNYFLGKDIDNVSKAEHFKLITELKKRMVLCERL